MAQRFKPGVYGFGYTFDDEDNIDYVSLKIY